jgi:hypothetical protein
LQAHGAGPAALRATAKVCLLQVVCGPVEAGRVVGHAWQRVAASSTFDITCHGSCGPQWHQNARGAGPAALHAMAKVCFQVQILPPCLGKPCCEASSARCCVMLYDCTADLRSMQRNRANSVGFLPCSMKHQRAVCCC